MPWKRRGSVNRYTSHAAHFNTYRCAQSVRSSHMTSHAHAWLKCKLCLPQNSHAISCTMSHAMHGTRSTSSSSSSSVPGVQRLFTSRNPCVDPRESGCDGYTDPEPLTGSAVQKMLVVKQMTQVVEVCSPIRDRWLTAWRRPGGRPRRSELMLWHWRRRSRQRGSSSELVRLA